MARYAANLLLEYGVREAPRGRPVCERRIVVFQAAGARAAIRRAKQLGKRAQFRYRTAQGNTVEVKFVGLIDVLHLDFVGPEEVYYSMRRLSSPQRHVRPDSELSVVQATSKTIGSSWWWAVPDRLGNTYSVPFLVGIVRAMYSDYLAGQSLRVEQLIEANLFADFLEMGDHLLEQGYKDPAAVLAGGVLEEHLRGLCVRNGVAPVDGTGRAKKADDLNNELGTSNIYSKLDQKSVTAWLDLRNKAAHGRYANTARTRFSS